MSYSVFIPCKPSQDSIVFVGVAGAYPSETPFRSSILRQAPGLAHKQLTKLEMLARSKHSSELFTKIRNLDSKKFYDIGPQSEFSTLDMVVPLHFFQISKTGQLKVENSTKTTFRFFHGLSCQLSLSPHNLKIKKCSFK